MASDPDQEYIIYGVGNPSFWKYTRKNSQNLGSETHPSTLILIKNIYTLRVWKASSNIYCTFHEYNIPFTLQVSWL